MTDREPPAKRRLFVGTFLPEQDQERLGSLSQYNERLSELWKRRVRWVRSDKLHLTWLFLGSCDETDIPEIKELLAEALKEHAALTLRYEKAVLWPSAKRARTFVVVPNTVPDSAFTLQSDIQRILRKFVSKEEKRSYRPHITLARLDSGPHMRLEIPEFLPLEKELPLVHRIDCIDLIESHLGRGHDRYESLSSIRLR